MPPLQCRRGDCVYNTESEVPEVNTSLTERETMLRLHMGMVYVQLPAEVQPRPNTKSIQKPKLRLVDE